MNEQFSVPSSFAIVLHAGTLRAALPHLRDDLALFFDTHTGHATEVLAAMRNGLLAL